MFFENYNWKMLIAFLVSFAVTAIIAPVLIPYLRKLKFGQQILEDGPVWHEKKIRHAYNGWDKFYNRYNGCDDSCTCGTV